MTSSNRKALITGGATGGLLSILLLLGALLFFHWHWRRSGEGFWTAETRSPPTPGLGESFHSICSAQVEPQISCDNVYPKEGDLVYAEIQTIQLGEEGEANTPWIPREDKVSLVSSITTTSSLLLSLPFQFFCLLSIPACLNCLL